MKLPFVIKIFVLSIFECHFYTGFTVSKKSEVITLSQVGEKWHGDQCHAEWSTWFYNLSYSNMKVHLLTLNKIYQVF